MNYACHVKYFIHAMPILAVLINKLIIGRTCILLIQENVKKHCVGLVNVALMWVPFDKKKLNKKKKKKKKI